MNKRIKKIAIIGGGPAGMAAALQLNHFGIGFVLFERSKKDSLLKNAWLVENYLGVYPGKTGPKLLQQFAEHLAKNKIKVTRSNVELLSYDGRSKLFQIKTAKKVYKFDYVIVATGTKPRSLFENPSSDIENNIFHEVFPLLGKENKKVVIIGAGDAAFDNALNLAKSNEIIVCNGLKTIAALPLLVDKVTRNRNINYLEGHKLCNIVSTNSKKRLSLVFLHRRRRVYIEADYLLAAIGRLPQKYFYASKLAKQQEDELIRDGRLFLAGDVKNDLYRQVAIAVGDGVKAAMQIFCSVKDEHKGCQGSGR